jgi:hypothetical protein
VRTSPTTWQVDVTAEHLRAGSTYGVIVTRPEPSGGTPGPTVCTITAGPDGAGRCTGTLDVAAGSLPLAISVMSPQPDGRAAASGQFQ